MCDSCSHVTSTRSSAFLYLQAFPDVHWVKHSVPQAAIVGTVKAEFCNCYQISISQCQLCLPEEPSSSQSAAVINSEQALREVRYAFQTLF